MASQRDVFKNTSKSVQLTHRKARTVNPHEGKKEKERNDLSFIPAPAMSGSGPTALCCTAQTEMLRGFTKQWENVPLTEN